MRTIEQTFTKMLPVAIRGAMFRIVTTSEPVDIRLYTDTGISDATGMENGYWVRPGGGFSRFDVMAKTANQVTIKILVADDEAGVELFSVAGVVNIVPVAAATIQNKVPVSVGTAEVQVAVKNLLRRELRFANDGTNLIYLGAAGVTAANAVVRIGPGQVWVEDTAAAADWYAISLAAAQPLKIMEVL